jgi:hypothetical protein
MSLDCDSMDLTLGLVLGRFENSHAICLGAPITCVRSIAGSPFPKDVRTASKIEQCGIGRYAGELIPERVPASQFDETDHCDQIDRVGYEKD